MSEEIKHKSWYRQTGIVDVSGKIKIKFRDNKYHVDIAVNDFSERLEEAMRLFTPNKHLVNMASNNESVPCFHSISGIYGHSQEHFADWESLEAYVNRVLGDIEKDRKSVV